MKKPFVSAPLLTLITSFLITSSLLAQIPNYVPANGLVAWYPFNGNANDESGNGNNGTVNGATLTADRNGNANSAYSFDGVNDIIDIGANEIITLNNGITISFFMQPDIQLGTNQQILSHPNFSQFQINFENNQSIVFNTKPDNIWQSVQAQVNLNEWVHIIVTFSDYDNKMTIYVNGTKLDEITLLSTNWFSDEAHSRTILGGIIQPNSNLILENFKGYLDDIAIYSRALTPAEITSLYTGTNSNGGNGNNTSSATSTVPAGISYQAVARSAQGTALANTAVQVKFSLITDSLSGTTEYVETHSLNTNSLGLFATAFGTGTAVIGTWAGINWTHSNKYLKVELDAGNGLVDLGTQQLLSSPFAIRAQSAATIENGALPVYSDNAAAIAGGLTVGKLYRTATGELLVVY